ncbi:MAG: hypothetical protein MZV70_64240 [Desulfobacterales bacterium]|nr:hypothetical protein [Desulfobacterales bacterium]
MAAQYLRRVPGITTVYASSSGSRALIRICERGVVQAGADEIPAKTIWSRSPPKTGSRPTRSRSITWWRGRAASVSASCRRPIR